MILSNNKLNEFYNKLSHVEKDRLKNVENVGCCGQVLDATKLIQDSYTYSLEDLTVIIELDTSRLNFRIKKEVLFSFELNINDDTGIQILPNTIYTVMNDGNNKLLIQGSSSVTIPNIVDPTTKDTLPIIV